MTMDDEEDYPPEGGCLGQGSIHTVSDRPVRKTMNRPIGFVHFKDPVEIPNKGTKRPKLGTRKVKRRKR